MFDDTTPRYPNKPTEEVLVEAMQPKLSMDTFDFKWREKVDGKYVTQSKTVTLMPLVVMHQNRFTSIAGHFMDDLSFSVENRRWFSAIADTVRRADVLPHLIRVIAENDDVEITDEMMDNCLLQPNDMLEILKQFAYKNEAIGGPVRDFFENVWPNIKQSFIDETQKSASNLLGEEGASKNEPSASAEPSKKE